MRKLTTRLWAWRCREIKLRTQLQAMKIKLQDILEFQTKEKKKAKDLENESSSQRQRIEFEFEELHLYLKEQHRLILTSLNDYEHEILMKIDTNVSRLEAQKDSLKSLIPEIEEKYQQAPSVLLKDVKNILSRWENMKIPKPQPVVPEHKTCFQPDFPRQYFVLWKMSEVFRDKLSGKLGKMSEEIEWRKARCFAATVTLDPESANSLLTVSTDGKSVKRGDSSKKVPNNPKRFMNGAVVLGCEGFTSGKYYWEADVGGSVDWLLGVCSDTVKRAVCPNLSPASGFWVVGLTKEQQYFASSSPPTELHPRVVPRIVGVYLDYEAGNLSFYDVSDKTHLYTFSSSFTSILRPFCCVQSPSDVMTLCPLKDWE